MSSNSTHSLASWEHLSQSAMPHLTHDLTLGHSRTFCSPITTSNWSAISLLLFWHSGPKHRKHLRSCMSIATATQTGLIDRHSERLRPLIRSPSKRLHIDLGLLPHCWSTRQFMQINRPVLLIHHRNICPSKAYVQYPYQQNNLYGGFLITWGCLFDSRIISIFDSWCGQMKPLKSGAFNYCCCAHSKWTQLGKLQSSWSTGDLRRIFRHQRNLPCWERMYWCTTYIYMYL